MGWEKPTGYYVVDRAVQAVLVNEAFSVQALFHTLVSQAFTHRIAVRQPKGESVEIWGAGSRPWGLRGLAETANMGINTVRRALVRLAKLGLIRKVSNKLGTVVEVLRFFQFRRANRNADEGLTARKHDSMTHQGDTRAPNVDPYRVLSSTLSRSLPSLVDVPKPSEPVLEVIKPGTSEGGRVKNMLKDFLRGI